MKQKVYLETTIITHLVSAEVELIYIMSRHCKVKKWWDEKRQDYDLFISPAVLDEINLGASEYTSNRLQLIYDLPVLKYNEKINDIGNYCMKELRLNEKFFPAINHLSYAIYYEIDIFLTWNCKHLANTPMKNRITKICQSKELFNPNIYTPDHLLNK